MTNEAHELLLNATVDAIALIGKARAEVFINGTNTGWSFLANAGRKLERQLDGYLRGEAL
jgi:hypothetical protein